MLVELWTRKREMGDEDENDEEDMSGYGKSGVQICLIGLGRLPINIITRRIGTRTCHIWDGKLTRLQNSLKSQCLMIISPFSTHYSLSRPELYRHEVESSLTISLCHDQDSTPNTAHNEYSLH